MLSRGSIDKKKLNRIVMIHTRNKEPSSGVLGSKMMKTSLHKLDVENKPSFPSFDKLNVNNASSSVLSKNIDDFDQIKESNNIGD